MLTIGSLFAGYGGLDLGVQQVVPSRVAWHSEIEAAPSKVLAHRWPGVPNLGDITEIDWSTVEPVDIITGGYPCQPFSQAGARRGTDDHRHLWPYVANAVAALQPALVVFENVRGHLSLGFDGVLHDLSILGYATRWTLLRASDVGAPHQRARLFVVGRKNERSVRSRADRWGRLHRDKPRESREYLCDSSSGCNGHERLADSRIDEGPVRRTDSDTQARDQPECDEARLGRGWRGGISIPQEDLPVPDLEARPGDVLHRPVGINREEPFAVRAVPLERRPSTAREPSDVARTGRESSWPRFGEQPDRDAWRDRDVSVGGMVGAERQPDGASPVHWQDPRIGSNDRRGDLRAADVGAPHGRFRVFVVAHPADLGHERGGCSRRGWAGPADSGVTAADAASDRPQGCDHPDRDDGPARDGGARNPIRAHSLGAPADAIGVGRDRRPHEPLRGPGGRTAAAGSGAVDWGQYEPAIRRWERILGRTAPAPTEPGTRGGQRLSPRFVEFMMGAPNGWVTDVPGISRNDQLKMLGNGVVVQQAAAAVGRLLQAGERAA